MRTAMKCDAATIGGGAVHPSVRSARAEARGSRMRRDLGTFERCCKTESRPSGSGPFGSFTRILKQRARLASVALLLWTGTASAQEFAIFWFTIDCGGAMHTTGGDLELSGTIGQADAGPSSAMTGGDFEMTGGFWPGVVSPPEEGCAGGEKVKKARCRDRNGENQLKVSLVG